MAGIKSSDYANKKFIWLMEADVHDPENRNLLYQALDLSDTLYWTASQVTVGSAVSDPDGGTDAWPLTANNFSAADQLLTTTTMSGRVAVLRIALKASSATPPHETVSIYLGELSASAYAPTSIMPVYGKFSAEIDTVNNVFTISDLSASAWAEFELVWVLTADFANTQELRIHPGGYAQNAGSVYVYLPHLEDGLHEDGQGFRSRGSRPTTTLNGPDGADGKDITVRLATEHYITLPTDTPANTAFEEGLISPLSISVDGGGPKSIINGIATTRAGSSVIANADKRFNHLLEYDWFGRPVRYYYGEPGAAFSTFTKAYEGFGGQPTGDRQRITVPLTDPLYSLTKTMDVPKFKGFGQSLRCAASGDYVDCGENPNCWILGDLVVEFRVRLYSSSTSTNVNVSYGVSSGSTEAENYCWSVTVSGSLEAAGINYSHEYGAGNEETSLGGSLPSGIDDGDWHHIAVVRDDTAKTIVVYYDGEIYLEDTYTNSATGGQDGILVFGKTVCDVDEIRVWGGTKTQDQIRSLMDSPIDASDYLDEDLRAYYKLDEGLGDFAWEEVTNLQERRMNECYLSFDGDNDYVNVAYHADLEPSGGDWTAEVRVAFADAGVLSYALQLNNCYRILKTTGDVLQVGIHDGTAWRSRNATTSTYTVGQSGFVLITLRWNDTSKDLDVFVNGTDKDTTNHAGSTINTPGTGSLFYGATGTATNNSRIWVSEVRLWDGLESDANILARANDVLTGNETNLKLWHTFDENKASEVPGSIANQDLSDTDYAKTKIYDRQHSDTDKKDSSAISGATWYRTTGDIQGNARFVGTGEGYHDVAGKRKPYAAGLVHHVPTILVDPLNLVYFSALPPLEEFVAVYEGGRKLIHEEIGSEDDLWDAEMVKSFDKVYVHFDQAQGVGDHWREETTDASNDTVKDVQILHAIATSSAVGDGIYLGYSSKFNAAHFLIYTTMGNVNVADVGLDVTMSWQFWNGEDWEDLRGLVDGTSGFRLGGPKSWANDLSSTATIQGEYTKVDTTGSHWNNVSIVRWEMPQTWVKDSINDIETISKDSTDRWWIRCAITANAGASTSYDDEPWISRAWVSDVDVVTDVGAGLIKVASVPYYPLTVELKADNTTTWPDSAAEVTKMVIDRWSSGSSHSYASGFTSKGPDAVVGNYVGTEDTTIANFLLPILKGVRCVLYGDRNGDLNIAEIGVPSDQSSTDTITDEMDQVLKIDRMQTPPPASEFRLGYKRYYAELGEDDLNALMPISKRKDLLSDYRWLKESAKLADNAPPRYLESQPQVLETRISGPGSTDTSQTEIEKWVSMLGDKEFRFYKVKIPIGVIEYTIGTSIDILSEWFGLWNGVNSSGRVLYVLGYEDDAKTKTSILTLWG